MCTWTTSYSPRRQPHLLTKIPTLLRSWGLSINTRKSVLVPAQRLTYLGLTLDLTDRRITVANSLRDLVIAAISRAADRPVLFSQRLAGYFNFLRLVARLPLQLVMQIFRRDPLLSDLVTSGALTYPWQLRAEDYDAWYRTHPRWLASDATPHQLGFSDDSTELAVPVPRGGEHLRDGTRGRLSRDVYVHGAYYCIC